MSCVAIYASGATSEEKRETRRAKSGALPAVFEGATDITSPVKALDLDGANKKIRQQLRTYSFDSTTDGVNGRIDIARVASNNRVEDDWAVALGKGPGRGDMVYAGVYDGHA